jgi:hypothetical protein
MRSNTSLKHSCKRSSFFMWSVCLSVLSLMMVISVAHTARANEQQCKKREHEVVIGDLLFAFPAGREIRNVASQYACPKEGKPKRINAMPRFLDSLILSNGEKYMYHIYFFLADDVYLDWLYDGLLEDINASKTPLNKLPVEHGFYVYRPEGEKLVSKYSSTIIYIAKDESLVDVMGSPYIFFCSSSFCNVKLRLSEKVMAGTSTIISKKKPNVAQFAEYGNKFRVQATSYVSGSVPN